MSLDVTLIDKSVAIPAYDYVPYRENGETVRLSVEEFTERFPWRKFVLMHEEGTDGEVFTANITHNLASMAGYADLYIVLWHPEERFFKQAKELILPLEKGLAILKSDPDFFEKYNPKNGWGTYENLVEFVEKYLEACKRYPEAEVHVSR